MSNILIRNEELTVTISTLGAEIQSAVDKNGVERFWNGDAAFWTGRAPILFPVAGGFREDGYELDGTWYNMNKHGIVRKAEWELDSATDTQAVFSISKNSEGFPFAYTLKAVYTLEGSTIRIVYEVENRDNREFVYGIGSHEAYACPEGIENYQVEFDTPQTLNNHELVGNLIRHETTTLAENCTAFPLKTEYFKVDALVFTDLTTHACTLTSKLHDRRIRVEFPDCDVMMLWQKPGAGYICIEPWRNGPDYLDAEKDIRTKPGFVAVKPGEKSVTTHTISIL